MNESFHNINEKSKLSELKSLLEQQIYYSLDNYLYQNAIFLAERLHTENNSVSTLYILAKCYFQSGLQSQTYLLLKQKKQLWSDNADPLTKMFILKQRIENEDNEENELEEKIATNKLLYLFAVCCFKLSKYAESATTFEQLLQKKKNDNTGANIFIDEGAICFWMGVLSKYSNQTSKAQNLFRQSLKCNPLIWTSFEHLCQFGDKNLNPDTIFDYNKFAQNAPQNPSFFSPFQPFVPSVKRKRSNSMGFSAPGAPPSTGGSTPGSENDFFGDIVLKVQNTPIFATPIPNSSSTPMEEDIPSSASIGDLNSKPNSSLGVPQQQNLSNTSISRNEEDLFLGITPNFAANTSTNIKTPNFSAQSGAKSGDSQRLIMNNQKPSNFEINYEEKNKKKKPHVNLSENSENFNPNFGYKPPLQSWDRVNSSNNPLRPTSLLQNPPISNEPFVSDVCRYFLWILRILGRSFQCFSQYNCSMALETLKELPELQYQTGYVLNHVGKCYFEMTDYQNAENAFEQACKLDPYRLEGLEIYSTALWHMKKTKKLSFLAQRMSEVDRVSPFTFCAIGNCFSLQKDHETALQFFKRAIKVSNGLFSYAHTLAGHEHFANDELDDAMRCFRNATIVDPRHYNAWYGIGIVCRRQEKFKEAEYHFRKAVEIHPISSVLHCYLGMTLADEKNYRESLQCLEKAIELNPKNAMAKYRKAMTLLKYMEEMDKDFNLEDEFVPKQKKRAPKLQKQKPQKVNNPKIDQNNSVTTQKQQLQQMHSSNNTSPIEINNNSNNSASSGNKNDTVGMILEEEDEILDQELGFDEDSSNLNNNSNFDFENDTIFLKREKEKRNVANLALAELTSLLELVPQEGPVYLEIGRIYKLLGMSDLALFNFNMALNVKNPIKEDPVIKQEIDKLQESLSMKEEEEAAAQAAAAAAAAAADSGNSVIEEEEDEEIEEAVDDDDDLKTDDGEETS